MSDPSEGPLHDPPPTVASELPPILMGGLGVIAPGWDDRLNAAPGQGRPQGVAVISTIRDQPLRARAGPRRFPRAPDTQQRWACRATKKAAVQ